MKRFKDGFFFGVGYAIAATVVVLITVTVLSLPFALLKYLFQ